MSLDWLCPVGCARSHHLRHMHPIDLPLAIKLGASMLPRHGRASSPYQRNETQQPELRLTMLLCLRLDCIAGMMHQSGNEEVHLAVDSLALSGFRFGPLANSRAAAATPLS